MPKFAKQFALIEKIKKLVKKTSTHIFGRENDPSITEDAARKIQKNAYEMSHKPTGRDTKTPPYILLVDQLQVKEDQIFKAAVSTLAKIAINEPKNSEEISLVLTKIASNKDKSQEQIAYVQSKIDEIKAVRNIKLS